MQRIVRQRLYYMSYLTYTGTYYEPQGQATRMDARRSKDASVFDACQARSGLFVKKASKGPKDWDATFEANAIDRSAVPRT